MLIWNGYTIEEMDDETAASMIKNGAAVEVGPFDGLRQFPTKDMTAKKKQNTKKDAQ
jgi:hypothetical protein